MINEIVEGFREIKKKFIQAAKYAKKVDFNIKQIDEDLEESSSSTVSKSSASHVFSD